MLNDYYQNIGMKGFIQRYGIVNAVKRGAFMFIKLHLVKDYEVRKVLWQEHASSKIKPFWCVNPVLNRWCVSWWKHLTMIPARSMLTKWSM